MGSSFFLSVSGRGCVTRRHHRRLLDFPAGMRGQRWRPSDRMSFSFLFSWLQCVLAPRYIFFPSLSTSQLTPLPFCYATSQRRGIHGDASSFGHVAPKCLFPFFYSTRILTRSHVTPQRRKARQCFDIISNRGVFFNPISLESLTPTT